MSKLSDLQEKRSVFEIGGGEEKIKKQHADGKKTARERLSMLFDEDGFTEVDAFVTQKYNNVGGREDVPAEGVVTGYGSVDGVLVYAYAQDYTVANGSVGELHAAKVCKIIDMAVKMGAPVVGILDSDGARLEEGLDALKGYGEIFGASANASGVVPQISIVLGQCAGGAAFIPAMSDFTFMVDGVSRMYVNGPSVVKGYTNDDITAEVLGGAETHAAKSGMASVRCASEDECFAQVKKLISYIPSNNLEVVPTYDCADDINRTSETLNAVADSGADYDMKSVIAEVVDNGEFTEILPEYATAVITGFARMNGTTVGVVANAANSVLDSKASEKGARFVRFCDSFGISIVTFTDVSGFAIDKDEEFGGAARRIAKLSYAFAEATVPKVNVIVNKAYGSAYVTMNSKHIGADIVFAWHNAEISVMASDGAANIFFGDEIASSANPVAERNAKITEYKEKYANPYIAAARGYVDDVIEAGLTRPKLINALDMLTSKRESRLSKKHGNIPM